VVRDEPAVRRQAATALGQLGSGGLPTAPALIEGLKAVSAPDAFLEHALVQALIEGNDPLRTRPALGATLPLVQRGVLLALDQMADGHVGPDEVVPLLNVDDGALAAGALMVVERHPAWAPHVLGILGSWLHRAERDAAADSALREVLHAFESESVVQEWIAAALTSRDATPGERVLLLDMIGRSRRPNVSGSWNAAVGHCLALDDLNVLRRALIAIRQQRLTGHDELLDEIATRDSAPADIRLAALAALGGRRGPLRPDLFGFLNNLLDHSQAPLTRLGAAETLAAVSLTAEQAIALTGVLRNADPLILPPLLRALARPLGETVGRALLVALEQRQQAGLALPADVASVFKPYPPEVVAAARPLLERLGTGRSDEQAKARLEGLTAQLKGGDPRRGRNVFFGNKANCYGCHRVSGEGGTVGPDLTSIGATRSARDLIEAVVYPSASFAQGFDPVAVATTDGRVQSGIITREEGGAVVLSTADRTEVRLRPDEVEEIRASPVSIMPQGLDSTLSTEELRDLLSYLRQLNTAPRGGRSRR
jgi:putative heme-binding domain-containing protein